MVPGIDVDRAKWRNTLVYRLNPDLQVGVEYNPLGQDLGLLANWRAVRESESTPAVIFGTSSDRIGTPKGRAYYVTISKEIADGLSIYSGLLYGEFEDKFRIPAGVSYELDDHWRAMFTYDGVNGHPMVNYSWDSYNLSLILVGSKHPGLSFGVGF